MKKRAKNDNDNQKANERRVLRTATTPQIARGKIFQAGSSWPGDMAWIGM